MSNLWRMVPLALRAVQKREDIVAFINLIMPAVKEIARVWPEAWPRGRELIAELFPEMQRMIAAKPLAKFDVKWLQRSLNQLDNAGLAVDGEYGENTRKAVLNFQRKHFKDPDEWDGWAGMATCAAIWTRLHPEETK